MVNVLPLPFSLSYFDEPLVVPDYPIGGGEAEAGTVTHLLGGKEGLEYPPAGLLIHADAAIGYGYLCIRAGSETAVKGLRLVDKNVLAPDMDCSASRHGLPCIDVQVQDGLLDLPLVNRNKRKASVEGLANNDLPSCAAKHFGRSCEERIEVCNRHPVFASPREAQELGGKVRGASHHGFDALELLVIRVTTILAGGA